jgi:SnoaL-like domain
MKRVRWSIWTGAVVLLGVACASSAAPEPAPTKLAEPTPTVRATESPPTPTVLVQVVPTQVFPAPTRVPAAPTTASVVMAATPAPNNTQEQVRGPDVSTALTLLAVQFESALNRGDVEAAMAMFEDQAEVKIPPDVYTGQAQIRGWLDYLVANHFAAEPGFRRASGDRVTWSLAVRSDYLSRLGLASLDGTATLVAHDGKIASYTFVLSRDSAARHRAAQLAASQVLQDPVIVGLTSANIYGFNDVFRDSRGTLISYRDVLTSEPGSGPFYDLGGEPIIVRSGF